MFWSVAGGFWQVTPGVQELQAPFHGGDGMGYAVMCDQDGRWMSPFVYYLVVVECLCDGFELPSHLECVLR